jgi:hypothetical protein
MGSVKAGTRAGRVWERVVKWLGQFAPSVKMHFGEPKCRGGSLRPRGCPSKWEHCGIERAPDLNDGASIDAGSA